MLARVPRDIADVLERFAESVRGLLGRDLMGLRLFGSYARGEAGEDSDVDVLVLVRTLDFARKREILDRAGDLWVETGLLVSPLVMAADQFETWRRQERPLVTAILREGSVL